MTEREKDRAKLLAIPLDEISTEEMEQLRQMAVEGDWAAVRNQLIHYSKRHTETQKKDKEPKS